MTGRTHEPSNGVPAGLGDQSPLLYSFKCVERHLPRPQIVRLMERFRGESGAERQTERRDEFLAHSGCVIKGVVC